MPLPRYQPSLKRLKTSRPSLNDLDDACLSKILSYVLEFSSFRDDNSAVSDNGTVERNLSLVSKRWYFLTQTQIADRGVHRIDLDSLAKQSRTKIRRNCIQPSRATGKILSHRSQNTVTRTETISEDKLQSSNDFYNITLFRKLQMRLNKYKHIIFEGSLPTEEFKKLVVALDACRTERISFNIIIERRLSLIRDHILLPTTLRHIEKLTLNWNLDKKNSYSNELTWRIYKRAINLRILELHTHASSSNLLEEKPFNSPEPDPLIEPHSHQNLRRVVFNWLPNEPVMDCPILPQVINILQSESSVTEVETNDPAFIQYLIKSSDRACTTHKLESLKLSWPIRDINLLTKLLQSNTLGTEHLCIGIDDIELLNEVKLAMEYFKLSRLPSASCQLMISFKDQKFADFDDKIKSLVHLSRLADLVVNIESQQRISIDCCHLMWSVGRALQAKTFATDLLGRCLFKITILGANPNKSVEVTVPFGQCRKYSVNSLREDLIRHREIMKSLKKDCYNQFVKSVRGNLTP